MSKEKPKAFFAPVGIEKHTQYVRLDETYYETIKTENFNQIPVAAVGMLMSEKTGLLGIPNRHGTIYPLPQQAEMIGRARKQPQHPRHPLDLIIHYNTDHPELIGRQLERATAPYRRINSVDGVQVNNLRVEHLSGLYTEFKSRFPDVSIILQIHEGLMDEYDPNELSRQLYRQRLAFDHLWLDGSSGEGKLLDHETLLRYIEALRTTMPNKGIGVAGGLNPENLEESLEPILEQDPEISWDAQSGVQTKTPEGKSFDTKKTTEFILGSLALRKRFPIE